MSMESFENRQPRREIELFVDRIEQWVALNDQGEHIHLSRVNAIFLSGYGDLLPAGLVQRVLERTKDPECEANIAGTGLI